MRSLPIKTPRVDLFQGAQNAALVPEIVHGLAAVGPAIFPVIIDDDITTDRQPIVQIDQPSLVDS